MKILNGIYKGLMKWRYKHLSDQTFVTLLSILVGLCSGLAAVVLKTLVHTVNALLLQFNLPTFVGGNGLMLIYPLGGIILTILFVRYIVRGEIGHGIPTVLLSISRHKGELPAKNMWTSLVASTLTVAFGGSVGLEAPIASTGSAIGSNIGRFFRLNTQHVKLLLGCGAAGAIAGIFKAPIAGIWFVVEVFMFDLTMTSAIPLLLSALSAATVAYFLMGTNVQFAFNVVEQFSLNQIPFYIILGVVCALSSILFLRSTARVEGWFHRIGNGTLRAIVGGLLLGVMIFLFPPLFGEGYGTLTSLLHGDGAVLFRNSIFAPWSDSTWAAILLLLALIPMKCIATATTIGCGGGQLRTGRHGGSDDGRDARPLHGHFPHRRNHRWLCVACAVAHRLCRDLHWRQSLRAPLHLCPQPGQTGQPDDPRQGQQCHTADEHAQAH